MFYLRHPHGEEGDGPVPVVGEDIFGHWRLVHAAVLVEAQVGETRITHIVGLVQTTTESKHL